MLKLPISRSWILSRKAQSVYLASAIVCLSFWPIFIGAIAALVFSEQKSFDNFPAAARIIETLFFVCAVGTGTLTVAMEYFWYGYDSSHWLKKAIWFPVTFLVPVLGPVLYYFFVYRRSPVIEQSGPAQERIDLGQIPQSQVR
jgi:hypothetical protein